VLTPVLFNLYPINRRTGIIRPIGIATMTGIDVLRAMIDCRAENYSKNGLL
jgi:hypothetical protein